MKRTHRVPVTDPKSAVVDAAYQREVDLATSRGERKYAEAKRRADVAFRKWSAKAQLATKSPTEKNVRAEAVAWELVELRRAELTDLARLMVHVAASSVHRTGDAVRPVPINHRGNL